MGIILSGMGSDGAAGIQAIKNELGMVMAQDPESAKFKGMPESVMGTGLADYILPPGEMPGQAPGIHGARAGRRNRNDRGGALQLPDENS